MNANTVSSQPLPARLKELTTLLTDLLNQVEQVQAERDQLLQRVQQLEAERDQLRAERAQILVAWSYDQISDEEIERRVKEPGGRTLAEFWAELGVK